MSRTPIWTKLSGALFVVGLALFGINRNLSAIFGLWGIVTLFTYFGFLGLQSAGEGWSEVRGLMRFGQLMLVSGAVVFSASLANEALTSPNLTSELLSSIGATCLLLGFGSEMFSFLVARES